MKEQQQEQSASWNMGRLMELATGYWKSAVLSAGVELGVFDALAGDGRTLAKLAAQLKTAERHLAEVLDALVALELLEKEDTTYRLAATAAPLLSRKSHACVLDALRFNMDLYPLWGRIPEAVRQGGPVLPPGAHLGADPERTRRFALGMHSRALGLAPAVLPALDPGNATTLLDLAAGPGTFSRLLAEQHTHLHVTQFDLAPVLAVAEELTVGHPAADRITFQPGDYHTDELPAGCERVLLCGAIHQENERFAQELFTRVRTALAPDGRFWIDDMMLEADRSGPLFSNLFSINMMLTSPQGRVFTADRLQALLLAAGFATVERKQPPWSPYWVLEAS